jgi:hypothetical protein
MEGYQVEFGLLPSHHHQVTLAKVYGVEASSHCTKLQNCLLPRFFVAAEEGCCVDMLNELKERVLKSDIGFIRHS